MKATLTTTLHATLATALVSMLSACGSSGDDQNDLVRLPTNTTEVGGNSGSTDGGTTDGTTGGTGGTGDTTGGDSTGGTSTNTGGELNPGLFNGQHTVDLGRLNITEQNDIDYDSRVQQTLYAALDNVTIVICVATFTIMEEDVGPNAAYTSFVQATEANDTQTVSIVDINGPTDNVGIEYIYSFGTEDLDLTSVVHVNYFSPDDVSFGLAALSSVECASPTDRFGQNEAQLRAVLNSVEFIRGGVI